MKPFIRYMKGFYFGKVLIKDLKNILKRKSKKFVYISRSIILYLIVSLLYLIFDNDIIINMGVFNER